jgi:putative flippase GtrA
LERWAGVILTFAAEAKWVFKDELMCHRAELKDMMKCLAMADKDLNNSLLLQKPRA